MIKILQIMDNIAVNSGVSSVVMNIYRNINRNAIQFDFLVSNRTEKSYEEEILKYGGRIFYTGNPLSPKTIISTCSKNKHFFMENSANYVAAHLHSPTIADMTIKYAYIYGLKNIIIHSHSTMFSNNYLKKIINTYLKRNITKYANIYFACSTEAAEFLYGKKFCRSHKVELIKNAIELDKYLFNIKYRRKIVEEMNWDNKIIIGHISNFSPIKNIDFLVPIIEEVVKKRKDIRFLFVGDGKTRQEIEDKLKRKKLDNYFKFLGSTNKVNYYLNAIDILVMPSIKEGLPVAVVEGQANGVQCFISDTITKEVDAGNVRFIGLDEGKWVKAICDYTSINEDERLHKSLEFEKTCFNIKNEIRKIEKIYLSLK